MKISLGCGVLLLAYLATCGTTVWIVRRQSEAAADRGWALLRAPLDRIREESGARALYKDSPGLQAKFPDEEAFLRSARAWHGRLEAFPAARPALSALLPVQGPKPFRVVKDQVKGQPRTWIRYAQPGNATFTVEYERDRIVDLDVQ